MNIISVTLNCSVTENTYFDIQTLINLKLVNKEISEFINLAGILYEEYYKTCPDLVYEFENQKPWANFYDAVEYSEINMITLLNILKNEKNKKDIHISSNIIKQNSESAKSFEITCRFLSYLPVDMDYILENYITYKLFSF